MFSWVLAALLAISQPGMEIDPEIEPPAQVMAIPPDLRARLQQEVLAGSPSKHTRLDRLLHLMFDQDRLGLLYQDDATGSVAKVYSTRTANCLSFTLFFIALAREAGLDAHPQEIRETLAWHQDNGVFYREDHINAIVRISGTEYLADVARDSVIALHKPEVVSDERLLSHFYNNLAMRDMEQDRIAPALVLMGTALKLDPRNPTNWSNAGVLYLRNGDEAGAQRAYARALLLDPGNTGALANMANLAQRQGDHDLEAKMHKRLEREQENDPLYHYVEAEGYVDAGDYSQAIEHYERAIHLLGNEPRFYASLAHAQELAGNTRQAIKALTRAAWLSTGSARTDYRSQIDAMQKQ